MDRLIEDNVRKSYGENQVLNGISMDVKKGEVIAIIGASGCGKSTLVKMYFRIRKYTRWKL